MVSLCTNASILLCFCHQLLGGLGRTRYKKKQAESADSAGTLFEPLVVPALTLDSSLFGLEVLSLSL